MKLKLRRLILCSSALRAMHMLLSKVKVQVCSLSMFIFNAHAYTKTYTHTCARNHIHSYVRAMYACRALPLRVHTRKQIYLLNRIRTTGMPCNADGHGDLLVQAYS